MAIRVRESPSGKAVRGTPGVSLLGCVGTADEWDAVSASSVVGTGLTNTFFVDGGTTVALPDQNGSALRPFATVQQALDAVLALPTQAGVALICPGDYSAEALSFAPTAGGELTLAGFASRMLGASTGMVQIGSLGLQGSASRLHLENVQLDTLNLFAAATDSRLVMHSAVLTTLAGTLDVASIEVYDSVLSSATIGGAVELLSCESSSFEELAMATLTAGEFSECTFTVGLSVNGGSGIGGLVYTNCDSGAIVTDSALGSIVFDFGDLFAVTADSIAIAAVSDSTVGAITSNGLIENLRLANCSSVGSINASQINELFASFCTMADVITAANIGTASLNQCNAGTIDCNGVVSVSITVAGSTIGTIDVAGALPLLSAHDSEITTISMGSGAARLYSSTVATINATTGALSLQAWDCRTSAGLAMAAAGSLTVLAVGMVFRSASMTVSGVGGSARFIGCRFEAGGTWNTGANGVVIMDATSEQSAMMVGLVITAAAGEGANRIYSSDGRGIALIGGDADATYAPVGSGGGNQVSRIVVPFGTLTANRTYILNGAGTLQNQLVTVELYNGGTEDLIVRDTTPSTLFTFPGGNPRLKAVFGAATPGGLYTYRNSEAMLINPHG